MKITSSYGSRIIGLYSEFFDTLHIYRDAVAYLIRVTNENWDDVSENATNEEKKMFVEHLVHNTKNNIAVYDFDKKFPHFHIKHRGEGWDIRMNMDGSFNSIKTKSDRRQKDEDFADVEKIAINWVKAPNASYPKLTNGELAEIYWDGQNS